MAPKVGTSRVNVRYSQLLPRMRVRAFLGVYFLAWRHSGLRHIRRTSRYLEPEAVGANGDVSACSLALSQGIRNRTF